MKYLTYLHFFLISFLLLPGIVLSQDNDLTQEELSNTFNNDRNISTKSATETIGSPYLSDKFVKGFIVQNGGSKTQSIYLRYNMEKNQVEFLRNKEIFTTDTQKIEGFNIKTKGEDIIFRSGYKTNIDAVDPQTFLRRAYNGKTKLLILHKADLKKDLASYGSATQKNKYNVYKKYYLVTNNGKFHPITSTEEVLRTLSDHKAPLKSYAQSKNLDFDNENDLVKLLKYYDKL